MKFNQKITALGKPSVMLIIAIICFVAVTMDGWRNWRKGEDIFNWDVANYYSYLPAYFGNNGSFEMHPQGTRFDPNYLPICPYDSLHIPKTTYGMALLYSPLYALGYKIAYNQKDPLNGFSEAFATTIHWGTILYAILGLLLLRNFLVKFFSEKTTTITLLILFFGTLLFYYSVSLPEMPHSNLFFLFSAFLLVNYHWHQKQTIYNSLLLGLIVGLISLIRPTDLMIGLIFIFWPIAATFSWKEKLLFLAKNYKYLLLMFVAAVVIWLPQMLFWKARTGHLLYFSYPGEQFFWNDPQIVNVLFSYRKGLLVYTPLISLAFIGFLMMKNELKNLRTILVVITLLNLYVVSSWWDWFFGGCFGARSFVQHFAYLSIPLAALVNAVFETPVTTWQRQLVQLLCVIVVSLGISLNLFQTYQYNANLINPFGMTKKTYWLVFGKFKLNEREQGEYWGTIKEPNYDKLRTGENRDQ